MWRGRALVDLLDVEPLALESARLEELRLVAVEGRLEADVAAGQHGEVTGELESLVAEHPLRERLWRLLVLALYRGERQADALAAYQRARAMLAGELGLEPAAIEATKRYLTDFGRLRESASSDQELYDAMTGLYPDWVCHQAWLMFGLRPLPS